MIIYDTLSKQKKPFVPRKLGQVQMFVCGPTVYDDPHIGHGRSYVCFDVVAKYLKYLGYEVEYYINITDIDDKIIKKAQEENIAIQCIANKYEDAFYDAMKDLGVDSFSSLLASKQMDGIIYQISELERKGFAYKISDGVYFDISKFPEHGKLSGRMGEVGLEEGDFHRVELNPEKRNPGDFVLWKAEKPGEAEVDAVWDSPWGKGRPGWHIEDTAITEAVFGAQYDIHGGGIDLVFPHHEAEISQMEAASGRSPLVNYWMHNGHLTVDGTKMGKSLGNFTTIKGAMDRWGPYALRYFFLSAHYRSSLNFTEEALDGAVNAVERLNNFILVMKQIKEKGPEPEFGLGEVIYFSDETCYQARKHFEKMMDNDFNVSGALAVVFTFVAKGYERLEAIKKGQPFDKLTAALILEQMYAWDKILGVMNFEVEVDEEIRKMVAEREVLRDGEMWAESDALRTKINDLGYLLDDTPNGTIVRKKHDCNG